MSVTQTTTEPELGSYEALEALFAEMDNPPDPEEETPSPTPPEAAHAPDGARAERATEPPGTDAAPPADSHEGEDEADPKQVTYPKKWKGTEAEWQEYRAKHNTALNEAKRERDRVQALADEKKALADRLTFLEAQTMERDRAYREVLENVARERNMADPARFADDYLNASVARGNTEYGTLRQLREADERAEAEREAQAIRSQQGADADAEAIRQATYWRHYPLAADYAIEQGVTGLDLHTIFAQAFATEEIADDVEESRRADISEERRARLVARVYAKAITYAKSRVDDARAAKAKAAEERPDTSEGRRTAVGGTAAGAGAPLPEFSNEAFEREMTAHFREMDRQDAAGKRRKTVATR